MEQPRNKAALIATLHREKAYWEALLHVVSEEDMLLPGATGDWTFKDVVAHLTGWRKTTIARLAGALPGGQPLPFERDEDVQAVNTANYRANRDRPLADVLAESEQVWQQLVEMVEALPEADLLEPGRFNWMGGRPLGSTLNWSYGHLHEHAAQINDWLARLLE
jgi:hypothetical protein